MTLRERSLAGILAVAIAITGWAVAHRRERAAPPVAPPPPRAAALTALPRPLAFEANRGQWDGEALFRAAGRGGTAFVTRTGAVFALPGDPPDRAVAPLAPVPARTAPPRDATAFRMRVVGADDAARAEGLDELPGKANFFLGNDPGRWRTNVPTYAQAKVAGVLPGVDVAYYGREGQLEYDFVVAPGVDAGAVRIVFEGVESLAVNADGDLAVRVAGREVLQRRPQVYEEGPSGRRPLGAAYVLLPGNEVAFRVDGRDPSRRVVIDPVIVYGALLGGSNTEQCGGIAVDGSGGVFVAGMTYSADYPTSTGGGALRGSVDGFVAKLGASGIVFSTYLGGSTTDMASAIAVDASGRVYVAGATDSTDFPTVSAVQTSLHGDRDAFVAKLGNDGASLVYSTYVGGTARDDAAGIAVDSAGSAYVTGLTWSTDFPTANPFQATHPGNFNTAFVTKLAPNGASLVYSTYLGGSTSNGMVSGGTAAASGMGAAIAVDGAGSAYVAGYTTTTDFPTTAGVFQPTPGSGRWPDAFVAKLAGDGKSLSYSTYLGGSGNDLANGIAVDAAGSVYVAGYTTSTDFPTVNAMQSALGGASDAFVTKLAPDGTALVFSTYLGGSSDEKANGVSVDGGGHVYVAGSTSSTDFPVTAAPQPESGGSWDGFVAKLVPDGTGLVYATYLGGTGSDQVKGITLDAAGLLYVAGDTSSPSFPVGPAQKANAGASDLFVVKLTGPTLRSVSPAIGDVGGGASVTLSGDQLASGATVKLGGASATRVTWVDADTITAVIPAHAAGVVDVVVTNPGGAVSTLAGSFTYVPGPRITGASPARGPTVGGTAVTVTGSELHPGATVTFGGKASTHVAVTSATSLTAVAPPNAAGAADIVVTNPDGLSNALAAGFLYVPPPAVSGVAPRSGPVTGGTVATVSGASFQAGAVVSVGGAFATNVTVASPTSLTLVVPAHAAGAADVVVTNPDGQSVTFAGGFTYLTPPALAAVTPASGPIAGGTAVALTGTAFQAGATVSFGGTPATSVSVTSAASITAGAPPHAAGAVDVVVTNPDGLSATLAGAFTYLTPPSLASVSPTSGPAAGGTPVNVSGAAFQAGASVSFGGTPATNVSVTSATSLTAVAPPHAAGAVDVAVTNPDGLSTTLAGAFTFVPPPAVTSVEPPTGTTVGGTLVTLTGAGFQPGATVSFGGAASGLVSVTSATRLTAATGQHPPGKVDVVVTNPDGQAVTVSSGFTYVAGSAPAPTLLTAAPASGPEAGGTRVTLTGTGFQPGMVVSFGGALATDVRVDDATRLTAATPAHAAGVVDVSVSNPDGQSATLPRGFIFFVAGAPAPTIAAVTPSAGVEGGGWKVTLTGTGFMPGAAVAIGGQAALEVAVASATELTASVPAHAKGAVDVVVTNPDGQAATLAGGVSYVGKPSSGCGCASSGANLDLLLGLAAAATARLRRRPAARRRGGTSPAAHA